jgi:ligand-binding sensor domain-containing protein
VKSIDGTRTWFSTDKGLAYFDGERWAVWRPALDTHAPEMLVRDEHDVVTNVPVDTAPAHNYIFGIDFQGDDIWVATAKGVSHGVLLKTKGQSQ